MQIIKTVQDSNKGIYAVIVNDDGEEYPMLTKALHSQVSLEALAEDDWYLYDRDIDFRCHGTTLNDLPVHEQPITVTQSMYNAVDLALSGDELTPYIKVAPATLIEFPKGNYTINTRQELIEYLENYNSDNQYDVLPLNYFVAPSALFTMNEFLDKSNIKYFDIINKRRNITISQFVFLRNWLSKQGFSINSPLDITKAYFSWGICGIRPEVTNISNIAGDKYLRTIPVVSTSSGIIYPYYIDDTSNWMLDKNVKYLKNPSLTQVLTASKNFVGDAICWSIPAGRIQFTADQITITGSDLEQRRLPTLSVRYNTQKLYNLTSDKWMQTEEELEKGLKNIICCQEITNKLIYPTSECSFSILNKVGLSPAAAVAYILSKEEFKDTVNQEFGYGDENVSSVTKYNDLLDYANDFLYNKYFESTDYDTIANKETTKDELNELIQRVIDGDLNIDNISVGKELDMRKGSQDVYNVFNALVYCLNMDPLHVYQSWKDIIDANPKQKEYNLTIQSDMLPTELVCTLELQDNALRKSKEDVLYYTTLQAQDGLCALFVTDVVTTPSAEGLKPIPIGLRGYQLNTYSKDVHSIINLYSNLWKDYATAHNYPTEISYNVAINIVMATLLNLPSFKLGNMPELAITMNIENKFAIEDGRVYVPSSILKLREKLKPFMESLVNLTGHNCNPGKNIQFIYYVVNGRMSPDCFYPYKGTKVSTHDVITVLNRAQEAGIAKTQDAIYKAYYAGGESSIRAVNADNLPTWGDLGDYAYILSQVNRYCNEHKLTLSGIPTPQDVIYCLGEDYVGCLVKPLPLHEVSEAIQRVVDTQRPNQATNTFTKLKSDPTYKVFEAPKKLTAIEEATPYGFSYHTNFTIEDIDCITLIQSSLIPQGREMLISDGTIDHFLIDGQQISYTEIERLYNEQKYTISKITPRKYLCLCNLMLMEVRL